MRPMAAPVLGGLLISDEVIDIMIPVLFYWIRRARWRKLHAPGSNGQTTKGVEIVTGEEVSRTSDRMAPAIDSPLLISHWGGPR